MTQQNFNRFIENFYQNKFQKVFLRQEIRNHESFQINSSNEFERFDARSLKDIMNISSWENHLILLICETDQDINCQITAKFLELLKQFNVQAPVIVGFIDEDKNDIDHKFKEAPQSPRFYAVHKHKRYRPEFFNQEFSYQAFLDWANNLLFKGHPELSFNFGEEQQKQLILEIAKLKGDSQQVEELLENNETVPESDL